MELNKYNMYSMNVDNNMVSTKNQMLDEIKQMKQIYEYAEIDDFINLHYGNIDNLFSKKINDEMLLGILKKDNEIELAVIDKNGIVFGRRWRFIPDEDSTE